MLGSLSDPDALYPATSILLLAFVYAFIFRGVAGLVVNNCEIDLPLEFEFKFLAATSFKIFSASLTTPINKIQLIEANRNNADPKSIKAKKSPTQAGRHSNSPSQLRTNTNPPALTT